VVIVGMPASGKSTVGHAVAKRLGVTFADTDTLIEQRTGKLIREIFTDDGEAAFRHLEEEVVAEALRALRCRWGGDPVGVPDPFDHLVVAGCVRRDDPPADDPAATSAAATRPSLLGPARRCSCTARSRPVIDTNRRPVARVAAEIVGHVLGEEPTEPDQPNEEQE
jgi:shikimate kinase